MDKIIADWLIILPCLALSFFFSGMEAGVFSLNRWRIRQRFKKGDKSAALIVHYLDHPEPFLWTSMVGNTLTVLTVFVLAAQSLLAIAGEKLFIFFPLYLLFLFGFYTFCDLLPKTLFRQYPTRLTLFLARPFAVLFLLLRPLVGLIERISDLLLRYTGGKSFKGQIFTSRQELRNVMRESAQGLTGEERAMIERVMDLQNTSVREVMVTLSRFPLIHENMTGEEILRGRPQWEMPDTSLIPVWQIEGKNRRISGMLSLRTLLYEPSEALRDPVKEHLHGAIYIEETLHMEEALRRLQRSGQRAAVILGPNGKEVGLLRLIDILKVIFGEVKV